MNMLRWTGRWIGWIVIAGKKLPEFSVRAAALFAVIFPALVLLLILGTIAGGLVGGTSLVLVALLAWCVCYLLLGLVIYGMSRTW